MSGMSAEDALASAQSAFMTAMFAGDRAACEQLVSSDFSMVRPNADHSVDVILRDQWLDEIGGRPLEHVSVTDMVISAHGDVAVGTVMWVEKPDSDAVRRCETDIWTRTPEAGWRLSERHTSWCKTSS
jgi:hypothetical protein